MGILQAFLWTCPSWPPPQTQRKKMKDRDSIDGKKNMVCSTTMCVSISAWAHPWSIHGIMMSVQRGGCIGSYVIFPCILCVVPPRNSSWMRCKLNPEAHSSRRSHRYPHSSRSLRCLGKVYYTVLHVLWVFCSRFPNSEEYNLPHTSFYHGTLAFF